MSNTAENYESQSSASTEGLDLFFGPVQDSVPVESVPVQDSVLDSASDCSDVDLKPQKLISAKKAAQILDIDRRSVVRLLNWQKLEGQKDDRGRWQIIEQSVLDRLEQTKGQVQDTVEDSVLEVQDAVYAGSSGVQDADQSDSALVQDTVQLELDSQTNHTTEMLTKAVLEMSEKLQAANYRVGYLESQVSEKNAQIKLLTDSQSEKSTRWQRFITWFMGR